MVRKLTIDLIFSYLRLTLCMTTHTRIAKLVPTTLRLIAHHQHMVNIDNTNISNIVITDKIMSNSCTTIDITLLITHLALENIALLTLLHCDECICCKIFNSFYGQIWLKQSFLKVCCRVSENWWTLYGVVINLFHEMRCTLLWCGHHRKVLSVLFVYNTQLLLELRSVVIYFVYHVFCSTLHLRRQTTNHGAALCARAQLCFLHFVRVFCSRHLHLVLDNRCASTCISAKESQLYFVDEMTHTENRSHKGNKSQSITII